MTVDDQGRPGNGPGWLTLTEAAARTGYSRDALRQRIRRGKLSASKGNDGQLRVQARDLGENIGFGEFLRADDGVAGLSGAQAEQNAEKDAGAPIKLTKFVRYGLGEGIEKEVTDFAAEVAATSGVPQAPANSN